ncbi:MULTISPECIES: hypothetical protein [unclassified Micromonospora]|uniref:hypothetical protein n=1 Tax=unclassified Micromonospora TaxID=2617518 RepID=UPI00362B1CFB
MRGLAPPGRRASRGGRRRRGDRVSAAASEALWQASQGNVLYLRELVSCGQRDGTLACADGTWRLTGPLTGSAGVVEMVSRRLHALTPAHRAVLELPPS